MQYWLNNMRIVSCQIVEGTWNSTSFYFLHRRSKIDWGGWHTGLRRSFPPNFHSHTLPSCLPLLPLKSVQILQITHLNIPLPLNSSQPFFGWFICPKGFSKDWHGQLFRLFSTSHPTFLSCPWNLSISFNSTSVLFSLVIFLSKGKKCKNVLS